MSSLAIDSSEKTRRPSSCHYSCCSSSSAPLCAGLLLQALEDQAGKR
ncbi:MAG: hypothetical protein NTZ53_00240 [Cyanobacteria bacterium]|nr:hypothetical protein [Cyanobacteriota bacterium]